MSKIEEITDVEKYQILLQPTISTYEIRLLEHCGIGKGIEIRVRCENLILKKGNFLPANKRVNTWAYMELHGLTYEQYERIPEVAKWKRENY